MGPRGGRRQALESPSTMVLRRSTNGPNWPIRNLPLIVLANSFEPGRTAGPDSKTGGCWRGEAAYSAPGLAPAVGM